MHLSGNLILDPEANLDFDLGDVNDSSQILMPNGMLSLGGQGFGNFGFSTVPGFGPGTYTLIEAESISGGLGAIANGTINGLPASLSTQGGDVLLTVVPEPSSILLLAVAAIGGISSCCLGRYRRSRIVWKLTA